MPLFDPLMALTVYISWFFDFMGNVFNGADVFIYPSLYSNDIAKSALDPEVVGEIWGPFRWYDMFSIAGLNEYT